MLATVEDDQAVGPGWVNEVLRFWFTELTPPDWFKRNDAVDGEIRARFLPLHEQLAADPPDADAINAQTSLAAVIVLDQFPRNMFRGSPRAFASDAAARRIARAVRACGLDAGLTKDERLFLYLPFEHSEDAADQVLSVTLISALGDAELTRYAEAHKVIIDRFGRFLHRNAALGRASTPEETEFLKQPMSSF